LSYRVRRSPVLNAHQQEIEFMRHPHQLALGLFAEDRPPPYPDDPSTIIVSVSGGLDSDYAALWARRRWPKHPLILWHAHLEAMDWPDTPAHLDMLAAALGNCHLIICQAVYALNGRTTPSGCNGTTLRRVQIVRDGADEYGAATDADPAAIRTLLDFARKARNGQPPTKKIRYCTDYFKIRLFNTWARANRHMLGERSVVLSGERWAESEQRSHILPWEWRAAITLQPSHREWPHGWRMLWARPGIDRALHEVAGAVIAAGIEPHIGYFDQGETLASLLGPHRNERARARLSCRYCIFSHIHHIQHALNARPAVMGPAVQAIQEYEQETGYSWQQRGPLGVACTT
jgi:hypothetical protein